MACVLVAMSISLGPIEGSAASNRRDMHRCAYADCVTGGSAGLEKFRRNRPTEDTVGRLQRKIARAQAERRKSSQRDQNPHTYSAIDRQFAYSPFREISCRQGALLVQGKGFFRVNALECQGLIFTYLARKKGKTVRVTVDARYARIISARPL